MQLYILKLKEKSKHFTEQSFHDYVIKTHTSEIQSVRGKKSKGGGRPGLGRPWDLVGISRSTYFRYKSKNEIE